MCLGSREQAGGSSFYHYSLIVIRARVSRRRLLFASPGQFGGEEARMCGLRALYGYLHWMFVCPT